MNKVKIWKIYIAGLQMNRTHLMGILNVTPDSFFDGGVNRRPSRAIAAGKAMWAGGASIIDIGGESTRPGAVPVSRNQELARILPPITGLARDKVLISVDTRHATVMKRAAAAGAAAAAAFALAASSLATWVCSGEGSG